MNDNRIAHVLRMVAEGKVSVGEAQELLDALGVGESPALSQPAGPGAASDRKLAIGVVDNGQVITESVIPLALVYADRGFLPRPVRHYLSKFELDLDRVIEEASALGLSGRIADLREGNVNIWVTLK